jgi:integrase/recombinase XerD
MSSPVVVTIYVRHSADCKYQGDEFEKRCRCRKHFRWTANGKRYRRKAGTRAWVEAERLKREMEDSLSGRTPENAEAARGLRESIDLFIKDKRVQGVSSGVISKYTLDLARLRDYCESVGVYTVRGITREILTGFCATWETIYPSSTTRAKVRERCKSFLRYCHEAQWLARVPVLPPIKIVAPPTMPLSADEYSRLLDALFVAVPRNGHGGLTQTGITEAMREKLHALIQLMRWSGLAIRDAITLRRDAIQHDATKGVYRIVTSRQKTGTHVTVPIPQEVALKLVAVANGNPRYIFWTGDGDGATIAKTWATRYIRPLFEAAGIASGHMLSHRLRDTFAVDLLTKGVPMEEVSKLLGHTSIATTEKHYAAWVKGRQERLDALVIGTWG